MIYVLNTLEPDISIIILDNEPKNVVVQIIFSDSNSGKECKEKFMKEIKKICWWGLKFFLLLNIFFQNYFFFKIMIRFLQNYFTNLIFFFFIFFRWKYFSLEFAPIFYILRCPNFFLMNNYTSQRPEVGKKKRCFSLFMCKIITKIKVILGI